MSKNDLRRDFGEGAPLGPWELPDTFTSLTGGTSRSSPWRVCDLALGSTSSVYRRGGGTPLPLGHPWVGDLSAPVTQRLCGRYPNICGGVEDLREKIH